MANHPILSDIEAFLEAHKMTEAKFGALAVNDWKFVRDLRGEDRKAPRRLWPETEAKVRRFMATYRPEPESRVA